MPAGLQIWDASGKEVLDTTTWVGQILGDFVIAGGSGAGSRVDPQLALGTPFMMLLPEDVSFDVSENGNPVTPGVTFSGTNITWNAGPACGTYRVVYGVY